MSEVFSVSFEVPKLPHSPKLRAIVEQSCRNLVSLFADHEEGVNRALTESDGDKTTLSHSIVLDLSKNKQTDKLSFSIKGGDEITQAIPNPDEPDLFEKEPPLTGFRQPPPKPQPEPVPVQPPAPLGLPAPIEHLPGPRGEAEERAYQEGREAFARGETIDQTPYRSRKASEKRLREIWIEGWSDLKKETEAARLLLEEEERSGSVPLSQAFIDGKAAHDASQGMSTNPFEEGSEFFKEWDAGWLQADQALENAIAADEEESRRRWFEEGRDAYGDGKTPEETPYDKDAHPTAFEQWQAGWMDADQEEGNGRADDADDADDDDLDIKRRDDAPGTTGDLV